MNIAPCKLLLLAIVALALSLAACKGTGSVSVLEVTNSVNVDRGEEEIAARKGMRLQNLDTVRTGSASSAWLSLGEAKAVELSELTALRVDRQERGFVLTLAYGEIKNQIDQPLATDEDFAVQAGNHVLAVRGTVFTVNYTDSLVNVGVESGTVAVLDIQGNELAVLEAGESGEYVAEGGNNTRGNTIGNLTNGGLVTIQGERVYYCNSDRNGIYSMNIDGTDIRQLSDDQAAFLNVVGGRLYYENYDESGSPCVMVMNIDGTDRRKLLDPPSRLRCVMDGRIYYVQYVGDGPGGLSRSVRYSMNLDGTDIRQLSDGQVVSGIAVADNRIYYSILEGIIENEDGIGSYDFDLYSMNLDGTDNRRLSNDNPSYINVAGDRVYYHIIGQGYELISMDLDGTDRRILLSDNYITCLNVTDDMIYFGNGRDNYSLYSMNLDGTDIRKLNDVDISNINVVGGRIYYLNGGDDYLLYSMNLDGTDDRRVEQQ
ncbi:MAG: DUF5050 domain-containing protein [Lachnospiraceae bacterium]|jgi:hypothetical protein|nr:DUF5050 domain-containing protein [Lachnospiraceae bacterium]